MSIYAVFVMLFIIDIVLITNFTYQSFVYYINCKFYKMVRRVIVGRIGSSQGLNKFEKFFLSYDGNLFA